MFKQMDKEIITILLSVPMKMDLFKYYYLSQKRHSQQMPSDFVVCRNVLEESCSNSVDPDQTGPIGAV